MTDRLATLLRAEADTLEIPAPRAAAVLHDGRRQRRRRSAGTVLATAAVLAVIAGLALSRGGSSSGEDLPVATDAALQGWAVASGSTVQLGTGRTVELDAKVKSLYYTSAGVLARVGANAATDAPDSSYRLVEEDGTTSDLALDLGDRVPGTDPDLPFLAYADATADPQRWNVVLRDVRTGDVAHRIPVDGAFTWGGWVAPPVALSGDHVYVGLDDATLDVRWRSGEAAASTVLPASNMPTVSGGRETLGGLDEASTVVDAQTGQQLLSRPADDTLLSLSPDGRHALVRPTLMCSEDDVCRFEQASTEVLDVDTGTAIEVDLDVQAYGWTPRGDLLRVDDDSVDVCDPGTGDCFDTPVEVDDRNLRVGGSIYES